MDRVMVNLAIQKACRILYAIPAPCPSHSIMHNQGNFVRILALAVLVQTVRPPMERMAPYNFLPASDPVPVVTQLQWSWVPTFQG